MKSVHKFIAILIVAVIYIRYFIIVISDGTNLFLDLILYALLLAALIRRKYRKEFIIAIIMAGISLINSSSRNFFLIFTVMYLLYVFSIRQIAIINITFQISLLLIVSYMLAAGSLKSQMFPMTLMDTRERWDYGFGNPNTFALFVFSVLSNLYILLYKKFPICLSVILIITATIIGKYTGSRTFFLCVVLLLFLYWLVRYKQIRKTIIRHKFWLYLLPLIITTGLFFGIKYIDRIPEINLLLSGRLTLYHELINNTSIKGYILGNPAVQEELIDNGYIHLILEGGVVSFFVFIALYEFFIFRLNRQSIYYLPLLISFLAYGMTESIFTFILNFGMMVFWSILYASYIDYKRYHESPFCYKI